MLHVTLIVYSIGGSVFNTVFECYWCLYFQSSSDISSMNGKSLGMCMLVTLLGLMLLKSAHGQHIAEEPCSVQILVPGLKGTTLLNTKT